VPEDVFKHDHALSISLEKTSAAAQDHGVDGAARVTTIRRQTTIESGTERTTAIMARELPKKTRIITPVSTSPMEASFETFLIAN